MNNAEFALSEVKFQCMDTRGPDSLVAEAYDFCGKPGALEVTVPSLRHEINSFVGAASTGRRLDDQSRRYAQGGLANLTLEFGEDNMRWFLSAMQKISPTNNSSFYNGFFNAPFGETDEAMRERVDRTIDNLRQFIEPGGAQRLARLSHVLRQEGFSGGINPRDFSREFVDLMLYNSPERECFVRFERESRESMAPVNFLREYPEYERLRLRQPSLVWMHYNRYKQNSEAAR